MPCANLFFKLQSNLNKERSMSDDNVIKLGGKSRGKLRGKSDGNNKNEEVCCSFCGRSNEEVLKMVKGPGVNLSLIHISEPTRRS